MRATWASMPLGVVGGSSLPPHLTFERGRLHAYSVYPSAVGGMAGPPSSYSPGMSVPGNDTKAEELHT